jgi:23S rRNA (guanosine2251-2'-O)-methyltransferase
MAPAGIGDRVEGTHAVAAAIAAGRVVRLTVEKARADKPTVAAVLAAADQAGVAVSLVDDVRPFAGTTAPQGVVAEARPLQTFGLRDLVGLDDPPAVLVLDRVEDPRNVGAVARSAVAAGVKAMVVAERRAAPLSAAAFKAAAGAFEDLSIAVVSSIAEAVRDLHKAGLWTIGLDASGERLLFGLDLLADPVALVLGAEGSGLSRLVRDRLDLVVRIPIAGATESLNVSAAAALAVFELSRARGRIT